MIQTLYHGLKQINGVKLYTQEPDMMHYAPVLSFNLEGKQSEWVGQKLNSMGIAVSRTSLCACCSQNHEHFGGRRCTGIAFCFYQRI
ncbi:MAG: aminotransferase class V-fold PLP-dependent enzyme [Acutalibacteraceae bacterium]